MEWRFHFKLAEYDYFERMLKAILHRHNEETLTLCVLNSGKNMEALRAGFEYGHS